MKTIPYLFVILAILFACSTEQIDPFVKEATKKGTSPVATKPGNDSSYSVIDTVYLDTLVLYDTITIDNSRIDTLYVCEPTGDIFAGEYILDRAIKGDCPGNISIKMDKSGNYSIVVRNMEESLLVFTSLHLGGGGGCERNGQYEEFTINVMRDQYNNLTVDWPYGESNSCATEGFAAIFKRVSRLKS